MNQVVPVDQSRLPAIAAGSQARGIIPADLDSAWRIAQAVAHSGIAPKGFETAEKAMVAILHGLEVGMAPMAALQSIAVVNGRPSIWGDGAIALVRSSGLLESIKEAVEGDGDAMIAVCTVRRRGDPEPVRGEFSVADARKAGLWGKSGPWQQYPKRMLQMRARAFALRDAFADVLRGLRIGEEQQDVPETAAAAVPAAPPVPPAPPPPAAAAKPAETVQDAEFTPAIPDLAEWLDNLDGSLATVTTVDDLNALWSQDAEDAINNDALDADGKAKADAIYQKHLRRLQPAPKAEPTKPAGLSDADRATLIKALEIALKKAGNDAARLDEWRQANHAGLAQLLDAERDALIAKWEATYPAEQPAPAPAPAKSAAPSDPGDDFFPPFDPSAYEA